MAREPICLSEPIGEAEPPGWAGAGGDLFLELVDGQFVGMELVGGFVEEAVEFAVAGW